MEADRQLKLLHLTDIHGAGLQIRGISQVISKSDLVLVSGDITHFGKEKEAAEIIHTIKDLNQNILAVSGNCDYPGVEEFLVSEGISIHRRMVEFYGYSIAGIGGSLPCPGKTPFEYTEDDVESWLEEIAALTDPDIPLLFLTHQPPWNTLNDNVGNNSHVGSKAIRQFIHLTKPVLCLTGHIHEGIGIDTIDTCKIVNPGPFRTGHYAKINIPLEDDYLPEIRIELFTAK